MIQNIFFYLDTVVFIGFFVGLTLELHWTGIIETCVTVKPSVHINNGTALRTGDTKLTNEMKGNNAIKLKKGH